MRKTFPILLAILLAGLCLTAGCGQRNTEAAPPSPAEPAPEAPAVSTLPDAPAPPEEEPDGPDQPVLEAGPADGPLSETELDFFNEVYFNNESVPLRNQFLSSTYESPADIDLFQLFYNGAGAWEDMSEAERETVIREGYNGDSPDTGLTKCSAGEMDAALQRSMELTLAETNKVGLDSFVYLAEYDAYYDFHGDTNVRPHVDIAAGERAGGLVHLYYEDTFFADGWKCVTLRLGEDDGYKFVSNLPCDTADVPVR